MNYGVTLVDDRDLPEGKDWVVVRVEGRMHAFIGREAVTRAEVLAQAWAGARMLSGGVSPPQRRPMAIA